MNTPNSPFAKATLEQLATFARGLEAPEGETFDDLQTQHKAKLERQIEKLNNAMVDLEHAAIRRCKELLQENEERWTSVKDSIMRWDNKARMLRQLDKEQDNLPTVPDLLKATDFSALQRRRCRLERRLNEM